MTRMTTNQELRYRLDCISAGTSDGFGSPHELVRFIEICVTSRIEDLRRFKADMIRCDWQSLSADPTARGLVHEHDMMRELVTEAMQVLDANGIEARSVQRILDSENPVPPSSLRAAYVSPWGAA